MACSAITTPPVVGFSACSRLWCLLSALLPVLDFGACSQLSRLFSTFKPALTLLPVLGFVACPRLSRLFSTFLPVLDFLACPRLSRLSSTFSPVLDFLACPEIFITVGPCLMKLFTTPPSILTLVTWVPQSRLAFSYSACRLAIGPPALAKPNPTVCSLACRWRVRLALRADQDSFSIESDPLLDSKALSHSSELSYTMDTILPDLVTAE